jgi:hypothetical protein
MSSDKFDTYRYFIYSIQEYFDNEYVRLENRKFDGLRYLLTNYIELDNQIKLNSSDEDKLKRSKSALLQSILFYLENSSLKKCKKLSNDIRNLINIIINSKEAEEQDSEGKNRRKFNNKDEILIHTINPFYKKIINLKITSVWIDILINDVKTYDDVDKLLDCYVSELLFDGYSLEYLKAWWKETCSYDVIKEANNEDKMKSLIEMFKNLSNNCTDSYKIVLSLNLPKRLEKELNENKELVINNIKYNSVDKAIYKDDEKFFLNNTQYIEADITACDRYRALDLAIYNIENYIDIYRVIDNSVKLKPIIQCLFINSEKGNETISLHNKFKYTKEFSTREKEDILDFIELRDYFRLNNQSSESIIEIESVINIVQKMPEFTIENKVLNSWSSLEKIVSGYKAPSIIEKVNTIIPKVIAMYVLKQKMNHLWDRLLPLLDKNKLEDKELNECRRSSNPKKYSKERFATYLLREKSSKRLYENTEHNIVINRSVAEINNLLKNPEALSKYIKFVEESVRHSVNSLYRLRNNIVHNGGKVDISVEYNIMTLQHYVNCIMGTLIHHKRINSNIIIEEILHSIVSTYDSYINGINEISSTVSKIQKDIKRCDEEIRKLHADQVDEIEKKEEEKNKFVLQNEQKILEKGIEEVAFVEYLYL